VNVVERTWVDLVSGLSCLVGSRHLGQCEGRVEIHHVAEGSGKRSWFAVAPLCVEHHRGKSGLHGMGTKAFIRLYRPPMDSELGLLAWVAENVAQALHSSQRGGL
jgi:hypothetical protein